jgi:hypothetical protein
MNKQTKAVLADFSASDWLKGAVRSSLERDPVDALNDTEALLEILLSEFEGRI